MSPDWRSIDPSTLSPVERYRLLIGTVIPRPIAWVTTANTGGLINCAPFSFFNGITSSPMTVMIAIGPRQPPKDTLANLRVRGEAVIHLVNDEHLEACHQSGGEYAADCSEVEQLQLATCPSERVSVPRLRDAAVAMECRLSQELPIGEPATTVVFCEILLLHLQSTVVDAAGWPDVERLRAVARLGERAYLQGREWSVRSLPKQEVPPALRRHRDG